MPKQLLPLAGRPVLAHTLDRFLEFDPQLKAVVVLHPSLLEDWPSFLKTHFSEEAQARIWACAGGAERTESVHAGLNYLSQKLQGQEAWVAIHDAVRPFIDQKLLEAGFGVAEEYGNATAGVAVKSSLRMLTPEGSVAIDRSQYYHVQTPQIFRLSEILTAYEHRDQAAVFTDDASLAEAQGMQIHLFEGSYDNLKITTLEDLLVAEQLMAARKKA